jgi:hypothetical protein
VYAGYDDWRKTLNRAVHTFAAAQADADEPALRPLVTTMLREIGEALRIDCATLLALPQGTGIARHYHWCRFMAPVNGRPFEGPVWQELAAQLPLGRHSMVITAESEAQADAVTNDIKAYLRRMAIRAVVVIPIGVGLETRWIWAFGPMRDAQWPEAVLEHLQVLGDQVSAVLQRRQIGLPATAADGDPGRDGVRLR